MIRRLVDQNYGENIDEPSEAHLAFWFREMRSPEYLSAITKRFPSQAAAAAVTREVVKTVMSGADEIAVFRALYEEELKERVTDKAYWAPLRAELTQLPQLA